MTTHSEIAAVPAPATIISRQQLSGDTAYLHVRLDDRTFAEEFAVIPGQFVQLSVPACGEAPFSVASPYLNDNILGLCIRRAGHLTGFLDMLPAGSKVGMRGPYGNGFPVNTWRGKNILLLAGGLGVAPIRALLYYLLRNRDSYGEITLMYGAKDPTAILFRDELVELSSRRDLHIFLTVDFATEEPPRGISCTTGLLPSLLASVRFPPQNSIAALCGPPPMYQCLIEELKYFGFSAETIHVSLERRMKCGVGLCCHCAVGDLFCCTDGPVFRYSELQGIRGAL